MNGLLNINNLNMVVEWGAAKEPGTAALIPRNVVPCTSMCHVFAELHLSNLCAAPLVRGPSRLVVGAARPKGADNKELGVAPLAVGSSHVAQDCEAQLSLLGGRLLLTRSR